MSVEKFIRDKVDSANHPGGHSKRMTLDSAIAKMQDWRKQRIEAHETGHKASDFPDGNSLCFPGEIGGHFQADQYQGGEDQEIVLFFRDAKTQRDCD